MSKQNSFQGVDLKSKPLQERTRASDFHGTWGLSTTWMCCSLDTHWPVLSYLITQKAHNQRKKQNSWEPWNKPFLSASPHCWLFYQQYQIVRSAPRNWGKISIMGWLSGLNCYQECSGCSVSNQLCQCTQEGRATQPSAQAAAGTRVLEGGPGFQLPRVIWGLSQQLEDFSMFTFSLCNILAFKQVSKSF